MLERQSKISSANIDTAAAWTSDTNVEVATLAALVVEIGHVHPQRRKRCGAIRRTHPDLFLRMVAAGLAFALPDSMAMEAPADDVDPPEEADPFWGPQGEDDIPF